MSFKLGENEIEDMNEMNLIPLIDIMLVLMIIFMLTATVLNPSVPLNLPKTSATVKEAPPKIIQISVTKDAEIFWDNEPIDQTELADRMQKQSKLENQPTIQLRADKDARYETVAQILSISSDANLSKIAFISE